MDGLLRFGSIQARVILALMMFIVAIITIMVVTIIPFDNDIKNILLGSGTDYYPFTIQNIMWIFFFIGFGELFYRVIIASSYKKALNYSYLPEDETTILTTNDTRELYKRVKRESERVDDFPSLLKRLIIHFQTNYSISQTHELLNSQIDIKYNIMETQYSMIRYIVWVIPTFGFIGTVLGISASLAYAGSNDPESANFLQEITSRLGIAFYTTLVALSMSTILVFFMHIIQSFEEKVLVQLEEYVLDNFINRLYIN